MARQWDELGAGLEDRARQIRAQLGIDETLTRIGRPTLTGSPALRVMVAHDIDLTVAVTELDSRSVAAVAGLGAKLATRPDVRVVTFRKDIGHWNTDPGYPDGLYLFVECIVCLANREEAVRVARETRAAEGFLCHVARANGHAVAPATGSSAHLAAAARKG